MVFDKVEKQSGEHGTSWRADYSVSGHQPIWPDLIPSKEYFQDNSCQTSRCDQGSTKALEEKGLLHRFSLHDRSKSDDKPRVEDLYRFSGPERTTKRIEQVVNFEDYEARIKDLEARLATQTEKLERLIAAQVSHEPTDNSDYSNRPTNLARPADGAHYVFDQSGNGQLVGPHGEHQYSLINGERVWLKDVHTQNDARTTQIKIDTHRSPTNDYTTTVISGCSNGSCGSCSSCRPQTRLFR